MENVQQMSLLEVALKIMEEKGSVVNIYELIKEVLETKGLADPDNSYAARLYTDITTSSKFVFMGEDNRDLKSHQSLDEFDKDGASFNPKGALDDEDVLDVKDDYDEDEDEEESEYDDLDEDEDLESEEEVDDEEESEYDDLEYEEEELDEETDYDDTLDEDKYNKIMDDYEDLYEN